MIKKKWFQLVDKKNLIFVCFSDYVVSLSFFRLSELNMFNVLTAKSKHFLLFCWTLKIRIFFLKSSFAYIDSGNIFVWTVKLWSLYSSYFAWKKINLFAPHFSSCGMIHSELNRIGKKSKFIQQNWMFFGNLLLIKFIEFNWYIESKQ